MMKQSFLVSFHKTSSYTVMLSKPQVINKLHVFNIVIWDIWTGVRQCSETTSCYNSHLRVAKEVYSSMRFRLQL